MNTTTNTTFMSCSICQSITPSAAAVACEGGDYFVCPSCASAHYSKCECCGEMHEKAAGSQTADGFYCKTCADYVRSLS